MDQETQLTRMLWLVPEDVFRVGDANALGMELYDKHNCDIWVLSEGTALAFSPKGLLTNRGMAINYPAQLEITRPLFQYAGGFFVEDNATLGLEIPNARYWIQVLLQPDETDRRYCSYIKSKLVASEPFAFKAYSSYPLKSESREYLRNYLHQWIAKYSHEAIDDEPLQLGETKFIEYSKLATGDSYPEDGFKITCSVYRETVWPWLELYLNARKHFPRTERLSIEFFNPDEVP